MMLLNLVPSKEAMSSTNLRVVLVKSEVDTSFAPAMLVFDRRSQIYLCWERKRPKVVEITSMPKKIWSWPVYLREKRAPSCSTI